MHKRLILSLLLLLPAIAHAGNMGAEAEPDSRRAPVSAASGGDSTRRFHFGPQGNWGDGAEWGIGGRVVFSLGEWLTGFEAIGSFDVFFPDGDPFEDVSYWEANFNVAYNFGGGSLIPYAGAGLNIADESIEFADTGFSSSDTEIGINVLGGLKFPELFGGSVVPFVEGRYELDGGEQFVLTLGVLF